MTIVFDLATPKVVKFFLPMIERLRAAGVRVPLVTRDYGELNDLIRHHKLRAKSLGSFGGATLHGKLRASTERVRLLGDYLQRVKPDAVVTLSNPESSRAAFGLGIPLVLFNDLPESVPVGRLALPLGSMVCAPWIIPAREFARYGVPRERVFPYRALDPVIWLEHHEVDPHYREKLGLDANRPLVVLRETEARSAYVSTDIVGEVRRGLARLHPDWQLLNIPRYRHHQVYDSGDLLAASDAFVGGGGTMCIEAAYYGTPVIATRDMACRYMDWLFGKRLAEHHLTVEDAVAAVERLVDGRETSERRSRARRLFSRMTFPLEETVQLIMEQARKH